MGGIECVVTSRLEQGTLVKGDEVVFLPTHTASNPCVGKVFSIEMHHREHDKAGPGDNVGVSMKGLPKANMPHGGDIMVKKSDTDFKACESFVVQAMVLDHPGQLRVGYTPTCYVRTSHVACRLMEIRFKACKKNTGGQKVESPEFIEKGDEAVRRRRLQELRGPVPRGHARGLGRVHDRQGHEGQLRRRQQEGRDRQEVSEGTSARR